MSKLIITDSEGKIIFSRDGAGIGDFEAQVVDIPEGQVLVGIDAETKLPIFEEKPKTELQTLIERLNQQEELTEEALAALIELSEKIAFGGGL